VSPSSPERRRRPPRAPRRRGAAALAAVAVVVLAVAAASRAAAPDQANQQRVDAGIAYLRTAQNADGGYPLAPGAASEGGASAWAALALVAAGVNPLDQERAGGGRSALAALEPRVNDLSATADLALAALVARAADAQQRTLAGRDLLQPLRDRQVAPGQVGAGGVRPGDDGAAAPTIEVTALAVLAFARRRDPTAQQAAFEGARWLLGRQAPGAGWPARDGDPGSSVRATGLVLQAVAAAGELSQAHRTDALRFLRRRQNDDAGFSEQAGGPSAVLATAWAALGLWAAGEDPRQWNRDTIDPLAWLDSRRAAGGAVSDASEAADPVVTTAMTLPAFAGTLFPVDGVPRRSMPVPPTPPSPPSPPAPEPPSTPSPPKAPASPPVFTPPPRAPRPLSTGGVRRLAPAPAPAGRPAGRDADPPRRSQPPPVAPGRSDGDGSGGTIATPGAPDRPGGGGALVATGAEATATGGTRSETSRVSQDGGPLRTSADGDRGDEISGVVVGGRTTRRAAGDEQRANAAAAGLLGSQAGGATGRSVAIALAVLLALAATTGGVLELRRPTG
jgi:Prenyltransferase and squalene oxidase repeat